MKTVDFGSCQYESAARVYVDCINMLEKKGLAEFCKEYRITYSAIIPREQLEELLTKQAKESTTDYDEDDLEMYPLAPKKGTIESYFEFARDSSWDLWSASIDPVEFLTGFKCGHDDYHEGTYDNFATGLSCALLTYFYKVDYKSFVDFDT